MSDQALPAWKRAGLKHTKKDSYNPLKEGLKRAHDSEGAQKVQKPPKRVKVPKAERAPRTFEPDQLAYLRQYSEDRKNWKFSKQKQNWILKHMFSDIAESYSEPLLAYIEGLQGSSRGWVLESAKEVVQKWNDFMNAEPEAEAEAEPEASETSEAKPKEVEAKDAEAEAETKSKKSKDKKSKDKKSKKAESEPEPKEPEPKEPEPKESTEPKAKPNTESNSCPTEYIARRAARVIEMLAGERVELALIST